MQDCFNINNTPFEQNLEFDPPKEDILTLCLNISTEALDNIAELLEREGAKIPLAEEADLVKTIEASLNSDFIPDEIKKMIQANRASIEASFQGVKIEVVAQTLSAIASVKKLIAAAAT